MVFIDSHVNLHSEKYDDIEDLIRRANAAGVGGLLTISDKIDSTDQIKHISAKHSFIWRSVGVHPHYAVDHPNLTSDFLIDLAAEKDVIGVGECGLDFHYEYSPRPEQLIVLQKQIEAAQETGLPLIIHTRDADDDMRAILEQAMVRKPLVPLLHCYTGGLSLAEAVIDMGGYVAFSGIITFKNAEDVRSVAKALPMSRLIIETDCPYLAPVPKRGRCNEPAYLPYVAEKLAEIKDMPIDEIAAITTENFFKLFPRAERNDLAKLSLTGENMKIADG
ncbi:MAG: TatD family hydrolase [Pseudomonadota bacterium]